MMGQDAQQITIITRYEHQILTEKELVESYDIKKGKKLFSALAKNYGTGRKCPFYSLVNKGIKFSNYVGVLSVGNVQINILPKADRDDLNYSEKYEMDAKQENIWQKNLVKMLEKALRLKINWTESAVQHLSKNPILDIYLYKFIDEVEILVNRGLTKQYNQTEENSKALSGKLMVQKQLTKNVCHLEKFYVRHTSYDYRNIYNQILYLALQKIVNITSNSLLCNKSRELLSYFPKFDAIEITDDTFREIQYSRKSEDYREAINLAKMILLNFSVGNNQGEEEQVFALMFDMNALWEEYVFECLRAQMKKDGYHLTRQQSKPFWELDLSHQRRTIRPDIVCESNESKTNTFVFDTKWKIPGNTPSDSDLKQMYVDHSLFKDVPHTLLIYPETPYTQSNYLEGTFLDEKGGKSSWKCSMMFLSIENCENNCNNCAVEDCNKNPHWGDFTMTKCIITNR